MPNRNDASVALAIPHPSDRAGQTRRVAFASLIGTAIENYDFFIYGTAAALVFNGLFFTGTDPTVATIATFTVFATGFLARPLGAIIFGSFGDRIGRKSMLVATIVIMGLATVAIGILPTYAAIGAWAPLLLVLLRIVQGIAAGGEWGGAALMTVEHAPEGRRGLFGGFTQAAIPIAFILANLVFLPLTLWLSKDQLSSWGWRIPFLASIILVVVGVLLRLKVAESPVFEAVKRGNHAARSPFLQVIRRHSGAVALTALTVAATSAIGYIKNVYLLSYTTQILGHDRTTVLVAVLIDAAIDFGMTLAFAHLSDRLGRRTVFLFGAIFSAIWAVPFFLLAGTGDFGLLLLSLIGSGLGSTAMFGPVAALFAEKFKAEVRYTGASLGYQIGSILGGGFAPLIAAALFAATGTVISVSVYMIVLCVVSGVAAYYVGETRAARIDYEGTESSASVATKEGEQ